MSRIENAFRNKKAFITFVTVGDPDIETTEKLIYAMEEAGADLIEIGIPFSDPVAEGIIIQEADERALKNGCTTDKIFDMVERVRKNIDIPLALMTYLNPVYTYGKSKFMSRCEAGGIDGIIVPDMPYEEKEELEGVCKQHGVDLISMISPNSKDRAVMIAESAGGFLYCVSSLGVTGVRHDINMEIGDLIKKVKEVNSIPCAIGFGISTPQQAREMAAISDGVIVGSAIVKIVAEHGIDSIEPVKAYVKSMKDAIENLV